jgi:hypothetical protein
VNRDHRRTEKEISLKENAIERSGRRKSAKNATRTRLGSFVERTATGSFHQISPPVMMTGVEILYVLTNTAPGSHLWPDPQQAASSFPFPYPNRVPRKGKAPTAVSSSSLARTNPSGSCDGRMTIAYLQ